MENALLNHREIFIILIKLNQTPNLFIISITFETNDQTCSKTEKTWLLLVPLVIKINEKNQFVWAYSNILPLEAGS